MKKDILYTVAFTSAAMAVAVLAVIKYSVSMVIAFSAVVVVFVIFSYLFNSETGDHKSTDSSNRSDRVGRGLIWLSVPFAVGMIGAILSARAEGWNIGDTIGASIFSIFSLLVIYELLKRRRRSRYRPQEREEEGR